MLTEPSSNKLFSILKGDTHQPTLGDTHQPTLFNPQGGHPPANCLQSWQPFPRLFLIIKMATHQPILFGPQGGHLAANPLKPPSGRLQLSIPQVTPSHTHLISDGKHPPNQLFLTLIIAQS
jgi:hypothetical protein